jgi:hypothetical protein
MLKYNLVATVHNYNTDKMTITTEISSMDMSNVLLDMITKKEELEAKKKAFEKMPTVFSNRITILATMIEGYSQAITRIGDEFLVSCRKEGI